MRVHLIYFIITTKVYYYIILYQLKIFVNNNSYLKNLE